MLIVESVGEVKTDKNKVPYKQIFVATPERKKVKDILSGEVKVVRSKVKRGSIIVFGHAYLSLVNLRDKLGVEIKDLKKADRETVPAEFGYDATPGEFLEGTIVTQQVTPYEIPDEKTGEVRIVDYYTTPVLYSTEDSGFAQEVKRTFARNGHEIVSEKLSMTSISTEKEKDAAPANVAF